MGVPFSAFANFQENITCEQVLAQVRQVIQLALFGDKKPHPLETTPLLGQCETLECTPTSKVSCHPNTYLILESVTAPMEPNLT